MYIFYHASTGGLSHTLAEYPGGKPPGNYIETEAQDLGVLTDWGVVDGVLTRLDISGAQAVEVAEINQVIGTVREGFITAIPGQEMIYVEKEAEARAYLAQIPEPADLIDFPWLAQEVGVTAPSAYELAQVWLNMAANLRVVGSALEGIRLDHIRRVELAVSASEILDVSASFSAAIQGV